MYRSWIVKLTSHARFSTVCLHAGQEPDPATGSIITPIYQTSTYVQDELGKHKGYEYGRTHNPTRLAVERNLAAIEGGTAAYAFASGMAAIGAIATMLRAGDHVIVSDNVSGGTFRLFDGPGRYLLSFTYRHVGARSGRRSRRAEHPDAVRRDADQSHPVPDRLARGGDLAHRRPALVVDNTFASRLARPSTSTVTATASGRGRCGAGRDNSG
jgi:O-acetylhomoserine/O-acetylserine sulfhydrylase-like pyridoxal-dependent enzyme